jgi:hypothetical protein
MGSMVRSGTVQAGLRRAVLLGAAALVAVAAFVAFAALSAEGARAAPGDILWKKRFDSPRATTVSNVLLAVSSHGHVYVGATVERGARHGRDWMVARYSQSGSRLWVRYWDAPAHGDDALAAIAADPDGNVVLCGRSATALRSGGDYAVVRYTRAGVLSWAKRVGGNAGKADAATDVVVDGAGGIYVTGWVARTDTGRDWMTVKYTPAGTRAWRSFFDGTIHVDDMAMALTRGADGRVHVTGGAQFSALYGETLYQLCYSDTGDLEWATGIGLGETDESYTERGVDVAAWSDGVGVAGNGIGTTGDFTAVLLHHTLYGTDGRFVEAGDWDDPFGVFFSYRRMVVDANGAYFIGGWQQPSAAGSHDFHVALIAPPYITTDDDKAESVDGSAHGVDECMDVAVAPDGVFYATGYLQQAASGRDVYTMARGPGWTDRFTVRYAADGTSDDTANALRPYGNSLYVACLSGGDLLLLKLAR